MALADLMLEMLREQHAIVDAAADVEAKAMLQDQAAELQALTGLACARRKTGFQISQSRVALHLTNRDSFAIVSKQTLWCKYSAVDLHMQLGAPC